MGHGQEGNVTSFVTSLATNSSAGLVLLQLLFRIWEEQSKFVFKICASHYSHVIIIIFVPGFWFWQSN
jgi:hypothetical protein